VSEVKCLKCGHEWKTKPKSFGHPKWCPKCKNSRWDSPKQKEHFCHNNTVELTVSTVVIEGLMRRKTNSFESFAHTVERMLQNDEIPYDILYDKKTKSDRKKTRSIKVTLETHTKLAAMKKQYGIKTFDEVLFELVYNSGVPKVL
jgi:hypothetical protein